MCSEISKDNVSIVVPVYNVEAYFRDCVNSLEQQTHKNIEVCVVDDGSTDSCGQLCDEYSIQDARAVIIHKVNGGLSDARNYGLRQSSAEWLTFIDSDDYVSDNYVEHLYRLAIENKADVVVSNYRIFNNFDKVWLTDTEPQLHILSGKQAIDQLNKIDCGPFIVACGKLYSKEIFSDLQFAFGRIHEDEFIVHRIFYKAKSVVHTTEPLYYYRQISSSITGQPLSIKKLDYLDALQDRVVYFQEKEEWELYYKSQQWYLYRLRDFYKTYVSSTLSSQHKRYAEKKIISDYRKYIRGIRLNGLVPLREKMWFYVFFVLPQLYHVMRGI